MTIMSSSLNKTHDVAVPVALLDTPQDSGSAHQKELHMEMKKQESSFLASGSSTDSDEVVVGAMAAVDLESREPPEIKLQLDESERDCRICHLRLDESDHDSDAPIVLGCSCKDDLAAAHRHCAETWFKIKGDNICEICGSIACNISDNLLIEPLGDTTNSTMFLRAEPMHPLEANNCWQGRRFLNFVFACVIFFFAISWLFHFNVPS